MLVGISMVEVLELSEYDLVVVGAGLYGSTFANLAIEKGLEVLVIDKRFHVGGNIYTENKNGIEVHKYGAHIFHTDDEEVWKYINRFSKFNNYVNSPIANYNGTIYSLPFNMYTFNTLWGVVKPHQAREKIQRQIEELGIDTPTNLEEQAISLVGKDVYEILVKGYTEKQWGRDCVDLPPEIIKRLPVRFTYNNNYFTSLYQGIPIDGYTSIINKMLKGANVICGVDYLADKSYWDSKADTVVYTGPIDAYFDYILGRLKYRSVRFEEKLICDCDTFQGNAVVNHTARTVPWTRTIEHKLFTFGKDTNGRDIKDTIVSYEYSYECGNNDEPYYPINDVDNNALYSRYNKLSQSEKGKIFGGRLAEYKYYDMDKVIRKAIDDFNIYYEVLNGNNVS